ncbi:MAG TPA: hypothetical protein VEU62_07610, partial [Bryobacterales bacterium]|nr:hypothetical protein [Bryobacterales bacterium]
MRREPTSLLSLRYLLLILFACAAAAPQSPPAAPAQPPEPALTAGQIEQQQLRELLTLRRVYVDRLSGGDTANEIRDMVIAALQRSRLFIVTEDEARADAYLRGSAEDLVFTDLHASRDGLNVRTQGRVSSRDRTQTDSFGTGLGIGENEDSYSRERKHEATASIRLVARNGDVLWSTTQESLGAKYKGSSADVAEKIGKELAAAYARARKLAATEAPGPQTGSPPGPARPPMMPGGG